MSSKEFFIEELMRQLLDITSEAGALIMTFYQGGHAVDKKDDASPVTEADRAADRLIVEKLKALKSDWPVVSEEGEKPDIAGSRYYWLVDPIDGTRSFVRGSGYFTVNIGLIDNTTKSPVAGVIYEPVSQTMYWGSPAGAFCATPQNGSIKRIYVRAQAEPLIAIVSHSRLNEQTQAWLTEHGITERSSSTSSIKFCHLAEGKGDVYPRFGATSEWDTAAGHAILQAAGGSMATPEGEPFLYGKKDFLNGDFIAFGRDVFQSRPTPALPA